VACVELASASAGETERIAAGLAVRLAVGDVVTVSGELGAGKTTFVRGACRALGITAPVTSPTERRRECATASCDTASDVVHPVILECVKTLYTGTPSTVRPVPEPSSALAICAASSAARGRPRRLAGSSGRVCGDRKVTKMSKRLNSSIRLPLVRSMRSLRAK